MARRFPGDERSSSRDGFALRKRWKRTDPLRSNLSLDGPIFTAERCRAPKPNGMALPEIAHTDAAQRAGAAETAGEVQPQL
jgi:hypothetical protein